MRRRHAHTRTHGAATHKSEQRRANPETRASTHENVDARTKCGYTHTKSALTLSPTFSMHSQCTLTLRPRTLSHSLHALSHTLTLSQCTLTLSPCTLSHSHTLSMHSHTLSMLSHSLHALSHSLHALSHSHLRI